jgi:DNA-binding NarL/FixJ family response regulator
MALIQHLSKKKAEKFEPPHPRDADRKALTPRQLQLLELVANGLTNKEIAAHLNVSQFTVKNHISRVMRQMEAANRYDAVDMVRATGKLTPS